MNAASTEFIRQRCVVLKIIVLCLALGVMAFGVIGLTVARPVQGDGGSGKLLLVVLGVLSLSAIPAYRLIRVNLKRGLINNLSRLKDEEQQWQAIAAGFATLTIIGGALTEAIGLFGGIVVLAVGEPWAMIAVGASFVLLMMQIPSERRFENFAGSVLGRAVRL